MTKIAKLNESEERVFTFENSGLYPVLKVRAMRRRRTEIERQMYQKVVELFPENHWRSFYPIMNIGIIAHICCLDLRYLIHINNKGEIEDPKIMEALDDCGWYVYTLKWDELKEPKSLETFTKSIKNRIAQRKNKKVKPYKNRKDVIRLENFGVHIANGSRVEGFELLSLPAQWTERIQIEKLGHKESIEYMDWCVQNVMKHPYYKEFAEYGAFSKNLRLSAINFKNGTRTGKIPYGLITGMWQHMEISVKKINSALKKGLKLSVSIPAQTSSQLPLQTTKPKPEVQFQHN